MIATHSRAVEDDQMVGWDWRTRTSASNIDANEFMPPHRSVF